MRGQWWAPGQVSYPRLHAVLPGQRPSPMTLDCFPLPCSGILFHQLPSLVLAGATALSSSTDVGLPSSLSILSYKWVKDGPWMLAPMLFVSSLISKQVPNSLPWVPNSNSYIPCCSTYSPTVHVFSHLESACFVYLWNSAWHLLAIDMQTCGYKRPQTIAALGSFLTQSLPPPAAEWHHLYP